MIYSLYKLMKPLVRHRYLTGFLLVSVAAISVTGMWLFEQGKNPQFTGLLDYLYWWETVMLTVGFGDKVPVTTGGRVVYMLTAPLSIGLGAATIAISVAKLLEVFTKRTSGTGIFPGRGHLVIVGWRTVSRQLLNQIPDSLEVVLISSQRWDDLEWPELRDRRVAFLVRGKPSLSDTLLRAGLPNARWLVVTSESDGEIMLTGKTAERLAKGVTVIGLPNRVENIDRVEETGAIALCPVTETAETCAAALRAFGAILLIGEGEIVQAVTNLILGGLIPFEGDPTADADLIRAGIKGIGAALTVLADDANACLCVASIKALSPNTFVVSVVSDPDNVSDLQVSGADLVVCPAIKVAKAIAAQIISEVPHEEIHRS